MTEALGEVRAGDDDDDDDDGDGDGDDNPKKRSIAAATARRQRPREARTAVWICVRRRFAGHLQGRRKTAVIERSAAPVGVEDYRLDPHVPPLR